MKQFLRDLPLRLRSDRKTQVMAVVVAGCVMYLALADNTPRRAPPRPKLEKQTALNDPNERWTDLINRFNGDLNRLNTQTAALKEDIDAQKKAMQEYEATTAEIFKKILEKMAQPVSQPEPIAPAPSNTGSVQEPVVLQPEGNLEGAFVDVPPPLPPERPVKPKLAAVMPGDSVRIKLLAGVNAPTDGTPYPVVLKLLSDVVGPDGNSVPLGEARIIAAAQGSLTDHRVLFRLTRLSLRLPNGKRKEFAIDGWIVGEDGIRGMEGVLIDPLGAAITGAGAAGFLAGAGQGIAAANVQNRVFANGGQMSTVNQGDIGKYAFGVGAAAAANEWSDIIKDRLSQMVPVVQVLSGREATAVFSQALAIPELLEQIDEENPSVVFTSMD